MQKHRVIFYNQPFCGRILYLFAFNDESNCLVGAGKYDTSYSTEFPVLLQMRDLRMSHDAHRNKNGRELPLWFARRMLPGPGFEASSKRLPQLCRAGVCPRCQAVRAVPDTQRLRRSCRTLGSLWERGLRNRDYHVPPCWWVCLDSNGRIPRREGRLPSFLNTREPPHLLSPVPLILTGKCFRS